MEMELSRMLGNNLWRTVFLFFCLVAFKGWARALLIMYLGYVVGVGVLYHRD